MGTGGYKHIIKPDKNKEYTYAELLELAKEHWINYYLETGHDKDKSEELAETTVLRIINISKLIRLINPMPDPVDVQVFEGEKIIKTGGLDPSFVGAPPAGNTMVGTPTSWAWAVATCAASICPTGGPTAWVWALLAGTVTIPIGAPTAWDWVEVCCEACELVCQVCESGCFETVCQTEVCMQSICQTGCEQSACQVGCEQSACQLGCLQSACQLACQICEAGCMQSACQLACQSCESGCFETVCQTEVCMQSTCQAACQDFCELNCQSACEVGCFQGICELGCLQSACQVGCMQTCCQIGDLI